MSHTKQGALLAIAAFSFWGCFPFYFKLLTHISPLEVLANRIVWSVIALSFLLLLLQQWQKVKQAVTHKKNMLLLLAASSLIAINWGVYIGSVTTNQLFEASLGYYINPLVNVMLAFVVLRERLRRIQWFAVLLAFIGVVTQIAGLGKFPWIALSLAFSFGFYGLIHKRIDVPPMPSLLLETLFLLPAALIFLGVLSWQQAGPHDWTASDYVLLAAAGPVTIVPLLLFTTAAKRLTYTSLGFFQYITPSVLFLLAGFFYQEPFSLAKLITFVFIWTALLVFSVDAIQQQKKIARRVAG